MIRPILTYGAPELEKKSAPILKFDEELKVLARDMLETMYAAPGVGLAAPQIGMNSRLVVIDISAGQEKNAQIVLANPEILEEEGSQKGEEGCLSIPGFTAIVERPYRVRVKAQDLEGNDLEMEGEELLARALCHEIDHLDGILYLDRISVLKRDLIKRKIRKLARAGEW
ncbi:MAG: peptide deformylase [Acidobacteriota bacterium]